MKTNKRYIYKAFNEIGLPDTGKKILNYLFYADKRVRKNKTANKASAPLFEMPVYWHSPSNKFLSKTYGISIRYIQKIITLAETKQYIKVKYKNGKRFIKLKMSTLGPYIDKYPNEESRSPAYDFINAIPNKIFTEPRKKIYAYIYLFSDPDSMKTSLRRKKIYNGCWQSNRKIATILNMSERSVRRHITKLIDLGFVYAEYNKELCYFGEKTKNKKKLLKQLYHGKKKEVYEKQYYALDKKLFKRILYAQGKRKAQELVKRLSRKPVNKPVKRIKKYPLNPETRIDYLSEPRNFYGFDI